MIVSHKYKFIFIKTAKTAGTSIEVYLAALCGSEDVITPIFPAVESHHPRNYKGVYNPFPELISSWRGVKGSCRDLLERPKFYNHMPAYRVRSRVGKKVWDEYFKFCVERDPWDRVMSHYAMQKYRLGDEGFSLEKFFNNNPCLSNYPLYSDWRTGEVIVNKILKYESLMTELGQVFEILGVPFSGDLGVKAKSDMRAKSIGDKDVLTNDQIRRIEKYCQREIQLLDYTCPFIQDK